jgi:hypothetical protein
MESTYAWFYRERQWAAPFRGRRQARRRMEEDGYAAAIIRLPYSSLLSFVCPYSSALLFSAFIRLALFIHRFYLAAVS